MKTFSKIDKNSFDGSLQTQGAFFKKARFDMVQNQINDSVKKYVDFENNRIFEDLTQDRACQVCDSTDRRVLFRKNFFPHVQCVNCSFVYVTPILKEDVLNDYYSAIAGSWADITENEAYTVYQDKYSHFHMDNIEACLKSENRTLLDVGCNNGEFLRIAHSRGWNVIGNELNVYAVARARKKGFEIVDKPLSIEGFNGRKFGAITLMGVLEHLPHPADFLLKVRQLLVPGGVLAIVAPNIDSITTRVLQEKCNTFDGIEHVNFWNRETFSRFFPRVGFELVHAETTISEIYSLNNYLHFEHPYACPVEYPLLLDVLTPDYVHQRFMGHHLCCYARLKEPSEVAFKSQSTWKSVS